MNALDGANLAYLDTGGDGGVGDGAGDGGAGDGAPIANATLRFTDINGKVVTTTTDATGYYRISLRGLKAPLVATVVRDAKPWKSMLVQDIVRAPANRNFYTINLTGLTDMVASEVAKKAGLSSPDAITPAAVASQKTQVPGIIAALNTQLATQISAAGLNSATFNPLTTPFTPVVTDSYDKLLESVVVVRDPSTGFTRVTPKYSLGGSINGLGGAAGLTLVNGGETLSISATATSFTFVTQLVAGSAYSVTVQSQPAGQVCTVTNGSGAIPAANVDNVVVSCTTPVTAKYSAVGSYPITDCVKDNSTGLIWEGKPTSGLRSATNYYTNYDDTTSAQYWNGSSFVNPTTAQINAGTNSIGYVNAVNASALCGYSNWRMPTLTELQGLVVTGVSPAIDSTWFPNTRSVGYWTSTPQAGLPDIAWYLDFAYGDAYGYGARLGNGAVRLVR